MRDKEQAIRLIDMVAYCFLHWRSALVVALVGALLYGGYSAARYGVFQAPENGELGPAVDSELSVLNTKQSTAIDEQYENLAEVFEYYENSLLMKINPNEEYIASANIVLSVSDNQNSDFMKVISAAYFNEKWTGASVQRLADEIGTTPAYLYELASLYEVRSGENAKLHDNDQQEVVIGIEALTAPEGDASRILRLEAKGSSNDEATALRDALISDLEKLHTTLSANLGEHSFFVSSQSVYPVADPELLDLQVTMADSLSKVRNDIASNERSISTNTNLSFSTNHTQSASARAIAMRGFLGGVVVFCIYGVLLCLKYLLGGTPEVKGQLDSRYGLVDLGSYSGGDAKYLRNRSGFDRWLQRQLGMGGASDDAAVEDMIAANVELYAGDAKNVLVSSSSGSVRAERLAGQLASALDGVTVACGNDLVGSAASREKLKDVDAVILVEEYGVSRFDDIDAELTLLIETGKNVLGIVMG